jgi:hypothetical protein
MSATARRKLVNQSLVERTKREWKFCGIVEAQREILNAPFIERLKYCIRIMIKK